MHLGAWRASQRMEAGQYATRGLSTNGKETASMVSARLTNWPPVLIM